MFSSVCVLYSLLLLSGYIRVLVCSHLCQGGCVFASICFCFLFVCLFVSRITRKVLDENFTRSCMVLDQHTSDLIKDGIVILELSQSSFER